VTTLRGRRNTHSLLFFTACLAAGCAHHLVSRPASSAPSTVIDDVAVLDVETGQRSEHQDVVVASGRVVEVKPTGAELPAGAEVVDGRGATLLPGLIDMHVHSGEAQGAPWTFRVPDRQHNYECLLYAGVTTLFDPGALDNEAFDERDAISRGEKLGPHMYTAGPVFTAPGGHPAALVNALAPALLRGYIVSHLTRQIATPADAEAAVASIADQKPDFVKMVIDAIPDGIPRLDEERARAIVAAAQKRGIRAVAHIGSTDDAALAARAGVSGWVHGVYRERIPDARIAELASFHIPMISTMLVFDAASHFGDKREPTALEKEMIEPDLLTSFDTVPPAGQNDATDALRPWVQGLRGRRQDWLDNLGRLHQVGVVILAGTDAAGVFPGPGLHRELANLVAAGFTPAEAIGAATIEPAKFLTNSDAPPFGKIAKDQRADLLLVNGDPTVDIAAVSSIRAVFLEGVKLDRRPLGK
jgi:imidazolonepropionase-like amidohydrolase